MKHLLKKALLTIYILPIILGCGQIPKQETQGQNDLFFKAEISPAFDEHAEVTISKMGSTQNVQFILRDAYGNDKPSDTFYFKTASLSGVQFDKINSELFQKIITGRSIQRIGIRDGLWLGFTFSDNGDTSILSFDNPRETDTVAFEFIKNAFDNFRSIFKDTIINGYLEDVQNYIDDSKKDSIKKGDRAIDKLRRLKYHGLKSFLFPAKLPPSPVLCMAQRTFIQPRNRCPHLAQVCG